MLVLLAAATAPGLGHAETYYVAERGKDGGAGTEKAPWKTLAHAAERVRPGDTVMVRPGVYEGFWLETSGRPDARIRFIGEPGALIDRGPSHSSRDNINLEAASYIDIEGFEVTSGWRAGIRAVECTGVHIRNNVVHDNGRWAIFTGFCDDLIIENNVAAGARREHGIYVSNASKRPVVRGNHIFGNRMAGLHMNGDASMGREGMIMDAVVENNLIHDNGVGGGAGINCDGIQNSAIRNNVLYDNHANGITLYRIDARAPSTGNRVVHNTIWMSQRSRWCIRIVDASVGNTFAGNICLNDHPTHGAIDTDEASLKGLTSDHNVLIGRFTVDDGDSVLDLDDWRRRSGQDTHSFTAEAEALFVDAARRDLRLRKGSPAIDRGPAQPGVAADYAGHRRQVGAAPDIGAIEYCPDGACERTGPHAGPALSGPGSRAPSPTPAAAVGTGAGGSAPEATSAPPAPGGQVGGQVSADERPAQGDSPRTPATPVKSGNGGCCRAQATPDPSLAGALLGLVWLAARRRRR